LTVEWGLIFCSFIAACAYFSYYKGYDHGAEDAIESLLSTLAENDIIDVTEKGVTRKK